MAIGRICKRDVDSIAPGASVRDAVRRMAERRIGALVVVDADNRPIGILTDRDLALRVLGQERDPASTIVNDVMSDRVVTVAEDEPFDSALHRFCDRGSSRRRLPVVDRDGRLVGIFTLDDVVTRIAHAFQSIEHVIAAQAPFYVDGWVR